MTAQPGAATSQPGGKRLRADARRNRARILEVAQEVFAAEGVTAPIDDIATRAGVGVGTIYRHFPTKEALFHAILAHRVDSIVADIHALAQRPDPGPAFFELFSRVLESGLMNKDLFDAMAANTADGALALSAEHGAAMMDALGELLDKAQRAGAVRTGITAADVKGLMIGAHAIQRHHSDDTAATARLVEIICDGLRPPRH
jgi:AcrR family transcriptional regulator